MPQDRGIYFVKKYGLYWPTFFICKNKPFDFVFFKIGDSLKYHDGQRFSTKDRNNNDYQRENCAVKHIGAWWYKRCDWSNLNGKYLRNGRVTPTGITWKTWKRSYYSMKRVEMKLRPI